MKTRQLGSRGLEVSQIGLGCMAMVNAAAFYGEHDQSEAALTIREALAKGITLFDTADIYGAGENEELLGRALGSERESAIIATKFGFAMGNSRGGSVVDTSPEYVRSACEASLKRLDTDYIDLYYIHRLSKDVPIEATMEALKELVKEGKVRYVGLSEVSAETVRRAHAVFPISAVQTEYSLLVRDVETELFPTLKELGIGFVPYSPLGRGFLTGRFANADELPEDDFRRGTPMFQGENAVHNVQLVKQLRNLADAKQVTAAQIAIAWTMAQDDFIVPIPGTSSRKRLAENIGSTNIVFADDELAKLNQLFSPDNVWGERYNPAGMSLIDVSR